MVISLSFILRTNFTKKKRGKVDVNQFYLLVINPPFLRKVDFCLAINYQTSLNYPTM